MVTRIGLIIILVAGWFLTGCKTASHQAAEPADSPQPVTASVTGADLADYTPEAVEGRTEAQARFVSGFLHDLNSRKEEAAEDYTKAALADLSNESLVLEVASRLLRFKQTEEALELLKKAAALPSASGELYAQLGLANSLSNNKEAAIEANRTAIRLAPDSLVGYRHLAQIYFQDNKTEQALEVLDQAARRPQADFEFLIDLGEFYLAFVRAGPNEAIRHRAKEVFVRAAEQQPDHPVWRQRLADGFAFLGEEEKALEIYQKLEQQSAFLPGLREKLVQLYIRKDDLTNAVTQLEMILAQSPTDVRAWFQLGSLVYQNKDLEKAIGCFERVIQLNPNFEPAYYELAGAHISLNHPEQALEVLNQARAKFKPNFVSEFYSALAFSRREDYGAALKHFTAAEIVARATDTNRLNHLFYFQLGATYEQNQQYKEAAESLKKCLELAPEYSVALNYLGYMWADLGENLDEARKLIEKAVKLEPHNAAYLDSLGWVLFRLAEPKEALSFLLKAIEYATEPDSTLHDHLGDVYRALEQPEKARENWTRALSLDPHENKQSIQDKIKALKSPAPVSLNPE